MPKILSAHILSENLCCVTTLDLIVFVNLEDPLVGISEFLFLLLLSSFGLLSNNSGLLFTPSVIVSCGQD